MYITYSENIVTEQVTLFDIMPSTPPFYIQVSIYMPEVVYYLSSCSISQPRYEYTLQGIRP